MASVLQTASSDAIRRIQRVQIVTIPWMSVEAAVSLFGAWRASSPSLLAFGGDSAIELFSAVVVLIHTKTRKAYVYLGHTKACWCRLEVQADLLHRGDERPHRPT